MCAEKSKEFVSLGKSMSGEESAFKIGRSEASVVA
eukprot:CAMPEP_0174232726 /NCGR_PEP_ID=MMETSP0417-20130205/2940_1 /TAXON_ID=242541 /ORGANISM="Mayorella sp, Strain BSH-02190019" /LENGTH=34 /DNA_ID= /DNA_START= /DNA_END= /DNA_ORIENTATION=